MENREGPVGAFLFNSPTVLIPTPNTSDFVPAYTMKITRMEDPNSGFGFWHASVRSHRLSAQGPSVLWCLRKLSRHIPSLKSELHLHGPN